ncbi:hypothetical protein [Streptomyces sp. SP18BB07]|uniref:RraA family protein n=1 Tax=Streptomyces sp. SP18BB07 TaxID=3002522 RepID=UPI003FCE2049
MSPDLNCTVSRRTPRRSRRGHRPPLRQLGPPLRQFVPVLRLDALVEPGAVPADAGSGTDSRWASTSRRPARSPPSRASASASHRSARPPDLLLDITPRVRRRDQDDGLHDLARPHDPSELTAMGLPACSRGVSAQGTVKAGPGPVTAPAVVACTTVQRGDVIAADADGVLRVPLLRRPHTLGHRRRDHRESCPSILDNPVQNCLDFRPFSTQPSWTRRTGLVRACRTGGDRVGLSTGDPAQGTTKSCPQPKEPPCRQLPPWPS